MTASRLKALTEPLSHNTHVDSILPGHLHYGVPEGAVDAVLEAIERARSSRHPRSNEHRRAISLQLRHLEHPVAPLSAQPGDFLPTVGQRIGASLQKVGEHLAVRFEGSALVDELLPGRRRPPTSPLLHEVIARFEADRWRQGFRGREVPDVSPATKSAIDRFVAATAGPSGSWRLQESVNRPATGPHGREPIGAMASRARPFGIAFLERPIEDLPTHPLSSLDGVAAVIADAGERLWDEAPTTVVHLAEEALRLREGHLRHLKSVVEKGFAPTTETLTERHPSLALLGARAQFFAKLTLVPRPVLEGLTHGLDTTTATQAARFVELAVLTQAASRSPTLGTNPIYAEACEELTGRITTLQAADRADIAVLYAALENDPWYGRLKEWAQHLRAPFDRARFPDERAQALKRMGEQFGVADKTAWSAVARRSLDRDAVRHLATSDLARRLYIEKVTRVLGLDHRDTLLGGIHRSGTHALLLTIASLAEGELTRTPSMRARRIFFSGSASPPVKAFEHPVGWEGGPSSPYARQLAGRFTADQLRQLRASGGKASAPFVALDPRRLLPAFAPFQGSPRRLAAAVAPLFSTPDDLAAALATDTDPAMQRLFAYTGGVGAPTVALVHLPPLEALTRLPELERASATSLVPQPSNGTTSARI